LQVKVPDALGMRDTVAYALGSRAGFAKMNVVPICSGETAHTVYAQNPVAGESMLLSNEWTLYVSSGSCDYPVLGEIRGKALSDLIRDYPDQEVQSILLESDAQPMVDQMVIGSDLEVASVLPAGEKLFVTTKEAHVSHSMDQIVAGSWIVQTLRLHVGLARVRLAIRDFDLQNQPYAVEKTVEPGRRFDFVWWRGQATMPSIFINGERPQKFSVKEHRF